ncbi:MAG TPA: cobalamin-dependent protein [Candidatus Sulfomarinibacteraceae bacterium]|nr:cobalamin-dependent protein [Candidatus Sulfomarinibacteraceae bacterium]
MPDLTELKAAIETGNRGLATRLTQEALAESTEPGAILAVMMAAMDTVGARFQCHAIYVPEMLVSARAMKDAMAILEPVLISSGLEPESIAIVGTIEGDLHDIGKNLVAMMWKGANIAVVDLGTNVAPGRFVAAAREHGASLVGVSTLLTTTMVGMRDVVAAIRSSGLDDISVVVGGAPVTAEFAASIGADGYARDAAAAVDVARRLLATTSAGQGGQPTGTSAESP